MKIRIWKKKVKIFLMSKYKCNEKELERKIIATRQILILDTLNAMSFMLAVKLHNSSK